MKKNHFEIYYEIFNFLIKFGFYDKYNFIKTVQKG